MDFAAYLLARDTGSADMALVEKKIAERKEHKIALNPGLPVYLRHFSARAGSDGWPLFHLDLYGNDAAFEAELARKEAMARENAARRREASESPVPAAPPADTLPLPIEAAPSVSP
jgi:murein L,D-transpeptidase YcbB/YkuD